MGELVGLRGPRVLAPRKGPGHRKELRWPLWGRHEPHGAPEVLTPREGAVCQASRSLSLAGVLPARPASWKPAGPAPAPELGPRRGDPRPAPRARPQKGESEASLCRCPSPPARWVHPSEPPPRAHRPPPPTDRPAVRPPPGAPVSERHPSANGPGGGAAEPAGGVDAVQLCLCIPQSRRQTI